MTAVRMCALVSAFLALAILFTQPLALHADQKAKDLLLVPAGNAIVVDGSLAPGEWNDASSMDMEIESGWTVRISFKHDAANLYFVFQGLIWGKEMRFPELLIDPQSMRSDTWQKGQWWLHSSFNLCEGNGEYNLYERNGVFQCAKEKMGWSANHFPLDRAGIMEMRISFARLGIAPEKGAKFGFAMDLTDTQKNWTFWPAKAELTHPNTWGTAQLE